MTDIHGMKSVILIVEDTPDNLDLLFDELRQAGFETLAARNGESALRQIDFAQPDLILLDVMLPGIDGYETCRRLKKQDLVKDIPVIFLTGLSDTTDKIKGFEAGGVDYLTKPFQIDEVIVRINTHLTIRQLQKQLQTKNILLEEEKLRFQTLADATAEGIVIHRDGLIFETNRAFEQMLRRDRPQLLGHKLEEFIAKHAREILRRYIENGIEQPYETEALNREGKPFPIEVRARNIRYQGQQLRIAAIRDLSEQKALRSAKDHLERENLNLRSSIRDRYKFGEIIGKTPKMQELYELLAHAAASDANVLISGDSGTGKGLVARSIHQFSERKERPFVQVNCGAIPENLLESEFFGYRKGAFTGADRDKAGLFDQAHEGTLFLDEVAELSPMLQVKLLQAIEEGHYIPLGSTQSKKVNVRIIAATNQDLETQVFHGSMREDFFYRLSVISVHLPPLRERREDLPLLIDHFLDRHSSSDERPVLPARIYQALINHDWPGNIRELQNVLERYLTVKRLEFPGSRGPALELNHENCPVLETAIESQNLQEALDSFEKQFLRKMLEQHRWHKSHTADALGIGRKTLYRKMKQFGLL